MKPRLAQVFVIGAFAVMLSPSVTWADWVFTPFVGPTFDAKAGLLNVGATFGGRKVTYGGSFGHMGPGLLGFEVDFGRSPSFFEGNSFLDRVVDTSVTTVMANVMVGAPRRSTAFSPYVSGGVGLIRSEIGDALNIVRLGTNAWGLNAGGGVMGFFNDQIGVRADIRYFKSIEDEAGGILDFAVRDLGFWRSTVGVAFRF